MLAKSKQFIVTNQFKMDKTLGNTTKKRYYYKCTENCICHLSCNEHHKARQGIAGKNYQKTIH